MTRHWTSNHHLQIYIFEYDETSWKLSIDNCTHQWLPYIWTYNDTCHDAMCCEITTIQDYHSDEFVKTVDRRSKNLSELKSFNMTGKQNWIRGWVESRIRWYHVASTGYYRCSWKLSHEFLNCYQQNRTTVCEESAYPNSWLLRKQENQWKMWYLKKKRN